MVGVRGAILEAAADTLRQSGHGVQGAIAALYVFEMCDCFVDGDFPH
ncbi:hypothetical protein HMPREF0307_02073 [Corynebacterium sp. DNF00584]|nr:hypothetical protein HMPREF0307_02073 [Corynebacterium sp. DNF00584]